MPLTVKKAPKTLPSAAKKIWAATFNSAWDGTCKGGSPKERDACAARVAWSAVKKKYKKIGDTWVSKSEVPEIAFYISRAGYDKATGEMRFRGVASDTGTDKRGDSTTISLFADFITRIKSKERPPEIFCSEYWQGGMPYISISHYSDYDGQGVPGEIRDIFIDGNKLKIKGIFTDTELGRACFRSICDDLYGDVPHDNKVRISIGFLDYKHTHKTGGYTYIRKNLSEMCPECASGNTGVFFEKGILVHTALTRVPVNDRTEMEVDLSMAKKMITRKEDAASIVGDDAAEELENLHLITGKSETEQPLVEKSEEESVAEEEKDTEEAGNEISLSETEKAKQAVTEPEVDTVSRSDAVAQTQVEVTPPMSLDEAITRLKAKEEINKTWDVWGMLSDVVYNILDYAKPEEVKSKVETALADFQTYLTKQSEAVTPFEKTMQEFSVSVKEVLQGNEPNKLEKIQPMLNSLGEAIVEQVSDATAEETDNVPDNLAGMEERVTLAVTKALEGFAGRLASIEEQVKSLNVQSDAVPTPRNLRPSPFIPQLERNKGKAPQSQIRDVVRKSVGLI